ncbi:MAG: heavy-metal-associated domain-containing protein [Clostridia bacterium]|nr:heavy-metal-associated domain-containing protein [Clostridia bacterium]
MKKSFKIEDLCCANCAAKLERAIEKLDGVQKVSLNFIAEKLTIEAEDEKFDSIIKECIKLAKRIEPDCRIIL